MFLIKNTLKHKETNLEYIAVVLGESWVLLASSK